MPRRYQHVLLGATAFLAVATHAHPPTVVASGAGRPVPVPFHETTLLLSERKTEGGVSIYEFVVAPESGGAPPHRHSNEDEYVYVLEGTLSLMLGEKIVDAGPGTLAALTRGTTHAFWNATDTPAKTLFFISSGGFERFFDAVAVSLREEPPEDPEAANARIATIAAEHDIELLPDLMPESVRRFYAPD